MLNITHITLLYIKGTLIKFMLISQSMQINTSPSEVYQARSVKKKLDVAIQHTNKTVYLHNW